MNNAARSLSRRGLLREEQRAERKSRVDLILYVLWSKAGASIHTRLCLPTKLNYTLPDKERIPGLMVP